MHDALIILNIRKHLMLKTSFKETKYRAPIGMLKIAYCSFGSIKIREEENSALYHRIQEQRVGSNEIAENCRD